MGESHSRKVIKQKYVPLPFELPALGRRRPRAYEEWRALDSWGRLPHRERSVPGYLLRRARADAGLSQQALANRLGCSQQAISQAERWQSNPTVGFMESWARETGCEVILRLCPRLSSGDTRLNSGEIQSLELLPDRDQPWG
jgi:DNA-binding XRE family transcriptional regulator